MRKALAIRHVAFEDLGIIGPILEAEGFEITHLDAGVDAFPADANDRIDLTVVLGGPIGAYERERYPFLKDELRFIEQQLAAGGRILGVCLGAQLLACALGAAVYPGRAKEIGFAPVSLTAEGRSSVLMHLAAADCRVLHWHGDTFDLPTGATRLASTDVTPNQAFSYGDRVLALQFHVETEPARFERWLVGHCVELAAAKIDVAGLRSDCTRYGNQIARAGKMLLSDWLKV
jgi:GMP synthase (glutamine-hydrolysing)